MNREALIERTISVIHQLPQEKAEQVSEYAEFVLKQYEEQLLTKGVVHLAANSQAFNFLAEEPELYSEADIKGQYNG